MTTHVFKDICLQVPVDNENGASCASLECLLVSFYDLLHGVKWCFENEDLLKILIYHFDFLDFDTLDTKTSSKCAERCHRVAISIF